MDPLFFADAGVLRHALFEVGSACDCGWDVPFVRVAYCTQCRRAIALTAHNSTELSITLSNAFDCRQLLPTTVCPQCVLIVALPCEAVGALLAAQSRTLARAALSGRRKAVETRRRPIGDSWVLPVPIALTHSGLTVAVGTRVPNGQSTVRCCDASQCVCRSSTAEVMFPDLPT
jgi:hypothetical protein